MVEIEVHIPRGTLKFILLLCIVAWGVWAVRSPDLAMGGSDAIDRTRVMTLSDSIQREREVQRVLGKREEILRTNLAALDQFVARDPSDVLGSAARERTRDELLALLDDRAASEAAIKTSLQELWDAEGIAASTPGLESPATPNFAWPVEPTLGISAHFNDSGYETRFGLPHHAIDIPIPQGTVVRAAADGVVVKVNDRGMGFNSIILAHSGGFTTLYGHVESFLVHEGDSVRLGDPIALSGGTPGTPGAGQLTTGAHLHFQVIHNGMPVDPEEYVKL